MCQPLKLRRKPAAGGAVFVSRRVPDEAIRTLRRAGIRAEVNPRDRVLSPDELIRICRGKEGLLCLLSDAIDRSFLDAAPSLRGIALMAVGFNNVDVAAATGRGIPVSNTPGVLTDATADLAWALLLAVARRIPESERFLRRGKFQAWGPMLFLGGDLRGKTLGIVGAGRIGTAVGLRSRGFGLKVIYTDGKRNRVLEKELGARRVSLPVLLKTADYLTLHVPLSPDTRHLIGTRELKRMKKTACLINTSRGPVVDEAALARSLQRREIAGAGLDVFENEPRVHPGLLTLENAVLLPHIGSATIETRTKMAVMAAENLVAMMRGKRAPNCINPEVYTQSA
ncbi:MAG: D-glycerate dehydrogenase [Candidatus Aureabacteria bacterium]|nr:D-glycerate dehydrogenase [Candidatus Auribacterota bacterium]